MYRRRTDASRSGELEALAAVYSFVLQKGHEKQNAVAECDQHRDGEDGTEIKGDSAYGRSIP